MTTWRKLLAEDGATEFVAIAPDPLALDVDFDNGWGLRRGPIFLAWTEDRVYFPVDYDGAEWPGSAPRHPQSEPQAHVGGGG